MVIRSADIDDAEAATTVLCRSIIGCCSADHHDDPALLAQWLRNKTPENVRRWLQAESIDAVVAEIDDKIVGFAMASATGELMLCYIVPEVRFKGVGKALLHVIEANAKTSGLLELHLESTLTAREFYLRNGFSIAGSPVIAFGMAGQPMKKTL